MRSLNKVCYISGEVLTDNNSSEEHIIPNALGGHLKSYNLVSEQINNTLFAKIDALLSKSIEFSQLIKFKRDRGEQPQITGVNSEGIRYSVDNNQKGTLLPLKPFLFTDENGNKFTKFPASQKEQYIESQLKKNPHLTREFLIATIPKFMKIKTNN
ncbi:MAG: HNH endonuclease [Segetibacter sp.]